MLSPFYGTKPDASLGTPHFRSPPCSCLCGNIDVPQLQILQDPVALQSTVFKLQQEATLVNLKWLLKNKPAKTILASMWCRAHVYY